MPRTKFHVTPETGRIGVTLNKRQLKEFKKMSVEFEMSVDDLVQVAIDVFIRKYHHVSLDRIDTEGIDAMFD